MYPQNATLQQKVYVFPQIYFFKAAILVQSSYFGRTSSASSLESKNIVVTCFIVMEKKYQGMVTPVTFSVVYFFVYFFFFKCVLDTACIFSVWIVLCLVTHSSSPERCSDWSHFENFICLKFRTFYEMAHMCNVGKYLGDFCH